MIDVGSGSEASGAVVNAEVVLVPFASVRFEPAFWDRSDEAAARCEVEMFRSGMEEAMRGVAVWS